MESIIGIILSSAWLLFPAYFSAMAPLFVRNLNFLSVPVDFNKEFFGMPLFGKNKTYRGFLFGIIAGIVAAFFQAWLYGAFGFFSSISLIRYDAPFLVGFLIGAGALFGDLTKSFFKRRLGILPGKQWLPFDNIDYALGSLVFLSLYYEIPFIYWPYSILAAGILHFAVSGAGYALKLR